MTPTGSGWQARNYRGAPVSLAAGPALGVAAVMGGAVAGVPWRGVFAAAGLALVAGTAGHRDDRAGPGGPKGLRGHGAAVRAGSWTPGAVKAASLAVAAPLAAAVAGLPVLSASGWIAGGAAVANLADLRPGRAGKLLLGAALATLTAGPGGNCPDLGRPLAAGLAGAVLGLLPAELAETVMLGDCGALTGGALAGLAGAAAAPPTSRRVGVAVLAGSVLLAEHVSLSAVIASSGWLRRWDGAGRVSTSQMPLRLLA